MAKFSESDLKKLDQCHPNLQIIALRANEIVPCRIITGFRGEEDQNKMFNTGLSKAKWGQSKHNRLPSLAIDLAPLPINWDDTYKFCYFAGIVMAIAHDEGVKLIWGGNWDGDGDIIKDQKFNDLVHFEMAGTW
jgi:peptidoglycan L-alanyl-D-glutamate endopeptidase CwlK